MKTIKTEILYKICSLLLKAQDDDEVFNLVAAEICEGLEVLCCSIWLSSSEGGIGQQRVAFYLAKYELTDSLPNLDFQVSNYVIQQGKWLTFHDIRADRNFPEARVNSLWVTAHPLLIDNDLIGILTVWDDKLIGTHGEREIFLSLTQIISDHLTNCLHNLIHYSSQSSKRLIKELKIARQIQMQLLPEQITNLQGASLGVRMIPANEVGGDYLDLFMTHGKNLGIAIGDVMGKGIPAALWMAMTRIAMRTSAKDDTQPHLAMEQVNCVLYPDLVQQNMFVTLFYALYEPSKKTLLYSNAGHLHPLLYRIRTGKHELLKLKGAFIGGVENKKYKVGGIQLQVGDIVLFYTDGLTEAVNVEGKPYGLENAIDILRKNALYRASEIVDCLTVHLGEYIKDYHQTDDISFVVLKIEE